MSRDFPAICEVTVPVEHNMWKHVWDGASGEQDGVKWSTLNFEFAQERDESRLQVICGVVLALIAFVSGNVYLRMSIKPLYCALNPKH